MLTGMIGMFVMTRYMQTLIWSIGNVFKWACMKLAIYFHLAGLEKGQLTLQSTKISILFDVCVYMCVCVDIYKDGWYFYLIYNTN